MKKEFWMTNREYKRQPRQGKFWCGGCDANHVYKNDNSKCSVCGKRNCSVLRNKK